MTSTESVPVQRHRLRRAFLLVLVFLLIIAICTLGWLYWVAHSALPQIDGTAHVAGISARVTVIRDRYGIPTIDATNFDDLFFAQGYITAQDRLWQMDAMRRFAAGELSEILGEGFEKSDREQRILGLRAAARKTVEIASSEDRARFEAYARGVNAYIESHRDHLPLEFRILGYSPRLWTPEDSMLIAAQMVKDLNHYPYRNALTREKILGRLGPELTADLYVNSSRHDRPPTMSKPAAIKKDDDDDENDSDSGDAVVQENLKKLHLSELGEPDSGWLVGSNNWVVSGVHTVSGKPLLSNDMHLGHQLPNLWYEAHLRCGSFEVAGVTLPGMPFVIVGHNQRIAWGFTNIGPTVEDVYIETFNANGQYLTPDGWKEPEHRHEVIHVKKKPDVTLDVLVTRHGPVISELVPGETRKLALRWTLQDGTHNPFFAMNSAGNWTQFRQALTQFDAPGQNVVYADVDGNIGYQATGKIPIRAAGDGALPVSGSDDTHEWTGYIPFNNLPSIFNPPSGIIATANGRITPDGYRYPISTGWEAPWRTARIYEVLESGKKFSAWDMLALQNDTYSEWEHQSAEHFVDAVGRTKNSSPRARQAAEIMHYWDGRLSKDSPAPMLAYQGRRELMRLLLEPKLGADWTTYHFGMQTVWMENVLENHPKRWLPAGHTNYDEILAAAVEAAVGSKDAPSDLTSWKWGDFNSIEIQNPVLGQIPILRWWTGTGIYPQSGGAYAVRAVTSTHGPSERATFDLSNWNESTLNVVTGQSGNFLSPYYMDQWGDWYTGHTFTLPFTKSVVDWSQQHELILEPGK